MSEAFTVPSLMMMTSIVSEESLARDTQTRTDFGLVYLKLFKVVSDFENNDSQIMLGGGNPCR